MKLGTSTVFCRERQPFHPYLRKLISSPIGSRNQFPDLPKAPLLLHHILPLRIPMPSWGVACVQLTKEEKSWFCLICMYHLKMDSHSTKASLETALEDSGEGMSSQWTELEAVHQFVHFAWEEMVLHQIMVWLGSWT